MTLPKERRLTRQQKSKIRKILRDSRTKNRRSRRDYLECKRRNAKTMGSDGTEGLYLYLQDKGAGAIGARQIIHPVSVPSPEEAARIVQGFT